MKNIFTQINDIAYGTHERQCFDIFIPESPESDCGIILFIHGGGWSDGDKSGHHIDAEHFCELGYICAAMNYRFVTDEISIFDELDDISSALTAIKDKCAEFGFNVTKAILSGGSAGGHLSLMYTYTKKDEAPVSPVAACVYCPPVDCSRADFLLGISGEFEDWKYEILSKCCGYKIRKDTYLNTDEQTALKKISPMEYVNKSCVPTSVYHGRFDELVPISHTKEFIEILNRNDIPNDLLIYENSGHAMKDDPDTAVTAKEITARYLKKYL